MAKLKLDLHDIYNRGGKIEAELNRVMQEAVDKRIKLLEIIPGKGSGQLKKRVLRFLNQPDIRVLYQISPTFACFTIALRKTAKTLAEFLSIFAIRVLSTRTRKFAAQPKM